MANEIVYQCEECKKTSGKTDDEEPPFCCQKRMKPIDNCTKDPSYAEHARTTDSDEPCDDGR